MIRPEDGSDGTLPPRRLPSKHDVERRKELFDLGDGDERALRQMVHLREAAVELAAHQIESRFITIQATRAIYEMPQLAAQARGAHDRYFADFGRFDGDTERLGERLAAVTTLGRLGLDLDHWLSAYHTFLSGFVGAARAETTDPEERHVQLVALIKAAFVDIGFAVQQLQADDKQLLAETTLLLNDLLDDTSGEAIVLQNLEGTILSWNQGAHELYGYGAHEIVGRPADLLFSSDQDDLDRVAGLFAEAREHGRATSVLDQQTKHGLAVRVELSVSLRRSGSGAPLGWLLRSRPLTPTSGPIVQQETVTGDGREATAVIRPTTETILVADDNQLVLQLVREVLERIGYQVISAKSGLQALELSRTTDAISLLLTDIAMPGMSGLEAAQTIHRERPEIKILFLSGYSPDFAIQLDGLDATADVLRKPFTVEELRSRVRQAIDR